MNSSLENIAKKCRLVVFIVFVIVGLFCNSDLFAINTTSGIYLTPTTKNNIFPGIAGANIVLPKSLEILSEGSSAFMSEYPSSYFVIREDTIKTAVNFKLYAITVTQANNQLMISNTVNENNSNPVSTSTTETLGNAFGISYTILSNRHTALGYHYVFTYDELLRLRKITRFYTKAILSASAPMIPVLEIHFDENAQAVYLSESIPSLEINFTVWFNPMGQITHKRIKTAKYLWERTYSYTGERLNTIATFNHGALISADVFSYLSSGEGYAQTLINKHNGRGQLLHTITLTPMENHGPGTTVENIVVTDTAGKTKSELMRFWNEHQLFEEWSYIKGDYQRTLYAYDGEGLLQYKTVLDESGAVLAQRYYAYEIPSELYGLVFIKQLTLRTSEQTLNFFDRSSASLAGEQRSVFDLYGLLAFYQEHFKQDGKTYHRVSYPGMEIITENNGTNVTKTLIDTQNQITLAERNFRYDRFGRLSESTQKYPDETVQIMKYFYAGDPQLPNLSEFHSPATSNETLITHNSFYVGKIFWEFVKTRQEQLAKLAPLSLENQFKEFLATNNNQGNATPLLAQEGKLIERLLFLRANKLSKAIAYDRQGNLSYYYRFAYHNLGNNILETRFTYYDTPPNLELINRRFETLAPLSNTYNRLNITSTNRYSLLDPYLRDGGQREFREFGVDGVNPNKERPRETIVIRHTRTHILPEAKQIFYNPYTGKPEREELIRGPLRTLVKIE